MQSLELSSAETSPQALSHAAATSTTVTAGWFLRRIALWILFVVLGIAGACVLYVAASEAEAEAAARGDSGSTIARAAQD